MNAGARQEAESGVGPDAARSALPRVFAWVVASGRSPLWPGLATGGGSLLVTAAFTAAAGRPMALTWLDLLASSLVYAFFFAAAPISIAILVRGVERDVRDLAPVLGAAGSGDASLRREALAVAPLALWLGVGFGLLVAAVTLELFAVGMETWTRAWMLFVALREIVIEVAIFGALGWGVGAALRLSQLTQERARPDLLDPRALAALARNGVRLAAVWFVLMAMSAPGLLAVPRGWDEIAHSLLGMSLVLCCFAGIALVLPCLGARQVLRSAKRAELERVRGQIAEARRTREDIRLPGLLAWESRVEAVPEWPIDASALGRTGLFLLLPLASWVGSAFVERLVDRSLE